VTAPEHNIFAVADAMRDQGWYMSLVAEPPAIQQTVNLVHAQIIDRYFHDLARAMAHAATLPGLATAEAARHVVTY